MSTFDASTLDALTRRRNALTLRRYGRFGAPNNRFVPDLYPFQSLEHKLILVMLRIGIILIVLAVAAEETTFVARTSYCPQWSADGKQLTFYSHMDGHWRIMTVNTNGSGLTSLSSGTYDDFYPSFSPKSNRIAFYSNRDGNHEIYSMNSDGSNVLRLTNNAAADRYPRWSPDGRHIAYACETSICVMNSDGSEIVRLTGSGDAPVVSRLSWSPDGSKIVFYSSNDKKEMSSDNQWTLFSVSIRTREIERLDSTWRRDSNPDWSRSANKIVIDAHRQGNWESDDGGWEVFVMNPNGTERRNLTKNEGKNDWAASWSPDGSKIAYCSGMNDQYEIYIMDANGNHSSRITNLIPEN